MANASTTSMDGRTAIRDEITISWDGGDPCGSALSNLFGLCAVVTVYGGDVPAEAEYQPGLGVERELDEYPDSMFAELVDDGSADLDDLIYWIRVLNQYAGLIPEDRRY